MSDKLSEVRDLFRKAEVPLDRSDVWEVQGTPVVKHRALERLAATLKIKFGMPTVLRNERDEAVLMGNGTLGDAFEWSIGEALVNDSGGKGNYLVKGRMSAYPYAMAEKRLKDRLIIKLANLQGVYSEEEADDFKAREEPQQQEPPAERKTSEPMASDEQICSIGDELKRTGKSPTRLLKHYGVKEPKYLTQAQAVDALAILKAAPDSPEEVKTPAEATA